MYLAIKRLIDMSVSTVGLVVLMPLLGVVALAIFVIMGRPVLFRQARPGLHGRPFTLMKFRTMNGKSKQSGALLSDEQRLTPLGKLLRVTSLDELPQLWNVLRGNMSMVGPRPLLMEYLNRYTPEQARRHDVLPGITGWAQVNGRNSLRWEEKFELDLWYVDHWSLGLDFKILWLTVLQVMRRKGISQNGHATMPEFTGTTTTE